jgi:hypothetical protein
MQKPGASPQVGAGKSRRAESAKFSTWQIALYWQLYLTSFLAPSALFTLVDLSWGVAPGFCIPRLWRFVETSDRNLLLQHDLRGR